MVHHLCTWVKFSDKDYEPDTYRFEYEILVNMTYRMMYIYIVDINR